MNQDTLACACATLPTCTHVCASLSVMSIKELMDLLMQKFMSTDQLNLKTHMASYSQFRMSNNCVFM